MTLLLLKQGPHKPVIKERFLVLLTRPLRHAVLTFFPVRTALSNHVIIDFGMGDMAILQVT
jgi:hypothetical protein